MASASPAVQPARPSGLVDFRKHAEYPILLGDSLKDGAASADQLIDVRFNWQPKAGLKDYESRLANGVDGYTLDVNDPTTLESAYRYSGHERNNANNMSSFALIFDKKKSAFVLESIADSVDLNLESAASQAKDDVRRRPKLPDGTQGQSAGGGKKGVDDDEPDPSNPFDFRNFLDDAKETVDKVAGSKSPMPGSRTPMSGFASPAAGPSRFTSTPTPTLPVKDSHLTQRKQKAAQPVRKPKPVQDRKPAKQVPLSNERISDSDEDLSESHAVPPSTKSAAPSRGHARQGSGNIGRSPHILVNDGDLEIDMGSPPPEQKARKRRIDAEVFRSRTGTPVIGNSPRAQPASRDIEMKDHSDQDEDGDVDELDLGSPQAKTTQSDRQELAPTPPEQPANDEDDGVAELEDLLGGDDDMDTSGQGLGLGISGAADDDSEVSEEE